jgi:hypothetical protein
MGAESLANLRGGPQSPAASPTVRVIFPKLTAQKLPCLLELCRGL